MGPLEFVMFWLFVLASLGLFAWTAQRRIAALRAGLPEDRFDQPAERWKGVFRFAFAQKRLLRDKYAGFYHLLIFWGFCALSLRSVELVLEGLFGWHLTEALGCFGYGYQTTRTSSRCW